jgi:hypothetical protein
MRDQQQISVYQAYNKPVPAGAATIEWFCRYIQSNSDTEIKNKLQAVADADTPDDLRKEIKACLPCFTPSGLFSKRSAAGLIQHSGFICLDIDGKDNPNITDWPGFRDNMMNFANVYFSALSASHKGCFVLIPIGYPDKHVKQFRAIERDLKRYGIVVDKNCSDVSRLRGLSYDPDAKINSEALTYIKVFEYNKPQRQTQERESDSGRNDFLDLIHLIIKSRVDITAHYEDWFKIGCCLASELGNNQGRAYFHDISRQYDGYNPDDADSQFNNCLKSSGKVSKATLFYIADRFGLNLKEARQ